MLHSTSYVINNSTEGLIDRSSPTTLLEMSSSESYSVDLFSSFDVELDTLDASKKVTIHGVKSNPAQGAGNLPGLLLLHGFPQTHHIWHKVSSPFWDMRRLI